MNFRLECFLSLSGECVSVGRHKNGKLEDVSSLITDFSQSSVLNTE